MKDLKKLLGLQGSALLCTLLLAACRSANEDTDTVPGETRDPTAVFPGIFCALSEIPHQISGLALPAWWYLR